MNFHKSVQYHTIFMCGMGYDCAVIESASPLQCNSSRKNVVKKKNYIMNHKFYINVYRLYR